MKTFLYLRTLFAQIGPFIYKNSKDPYKSIAHFFRSGAVWVMIMNIIMTLFLVVTKFTGQTTNWTFFDVVVEFVVALVVFFISKSFIKEEVE